MAEFSIGQRVKVTWRFEGIWDDPARGKIGVIVDNRYQNREIVPILKVRFDSPLFPNNPDPYSNWYGPIQLINTDRMPSWTLIRVHRIFKDSEIEAHTEQYPYWPQFAKDGKYYLEGFDDRCELRIPENHTWEIPEPGTLLTLLVSTWAGIFGEADPELGHTPEDIARLTARYILRLLPDEQTIRMEERSKSSFGRVWG